MTAAAVKARLRPALPDRWSLGVSLIAILFALPIVAVLSSVFYPTGEAWRHLVDTVLVTYVINSVLLMLGVAFGVLSIGVTTAWLVTNYEFPLRRLFSWAQLLPLAIPAYIIAYTYTGILDYAGPVQTLLRDWFGPWISDWFPEIRSLWGAMAMLSLVLYPYVYLLARAAFLQQSVSVQDASRLLGCNPWQTFTLVALPMARPAIIAGTSLALMETLADYGTVQYFGVDTFTIGIFRTWFGLGDANAAAQLASVLLSFVLVLVGLEVYSRRRARYHHVGSSGQPLVPIILTGWKRYLASVACFTPLFFGFVVPFAVLAYWSLITAQDMIDESFVSLVMHSFTLAGVTALLAVALSLFMAYGKRLRSVPSVLAAVRIAGSGYAIPGTVIAVGVLVPLAWLDNRINDWLEPYGLEPGLLLSGTLFALVFAYLVRFLAVSIHTVDAGLSNVHANMDDAGRSLGYRPREVLRYVHLPMIRGSLLTAALIVFVDVLKELPATLILRPFNYNTLAVRAFELASDERLMDSASAAIAIVLVGLIPVILLSRSITASRRRLPARA